MRPATQTGVPITAPGLSTRPATSPPWLSSRATVACRSRMAAIRTSLDRSSPGRSRSRLGRAPAAARRVTRPATTRPTRPASRPRSSRPSDRYSRSCSSTSWAGRRHQPMDGGDIARRRLFASSCGRARRQRPGRVTLRSCPRGIAGLRALVGRRSSSVAALRTIELATIDTTFPGPGLTTTASTNCYPAKPTKGRNSPCHHTRPAPTRSLQ